MPPTAFPPLAHDQPQRTISLRWLAVLLACALIGIFMALVAGAWWALKQLPVGQHTVHTSLSTPEVPVVLRTPGGLLDVASIQATERFSRRDTRSFWGIDLGETVTEVAVQTTYRFHMPLAQRWPIEVKDGIAIAHAPAIQPSLPVAFDTQTMQLWGRNGWARFNKDKSLLALQTSISPQLAQRAHSPHYRELATEAARRTVAEYVRTWLVTSGQSVQEVRVRFPGEAQALPPIAARSHQAQH